MEQRLRVLLLTLAIFLTFNVVTRADANAAITGQYVLKETSLNIGLNISKWFGYIYGNLLFRRDVDSSGVPSLVGKPAACLAFIFVIPPSALRKKELAEKVILRYKNGTGEWMEAALDVRPKPSPKGPSDTLNFTFYYAEDPELINRTVEYKLLSTNYTSCSILQTSAGLKNCSYWVLYTGTDGAVPEWCRPTNMEKCDIEVHTPKRDSECIEADPFHEDKLRQLQQPFERSGKTQLKR